MPCSFVRTCDIDPPCPAQLAPASNSLPNRICYEMAWRTVDCFLDHQPITADMPVGTWGWEYPAPIGERAIGKWLQGREEADRITEEAYGCSPVRGKVPDAPLVLYEDALLGLAVSRDAWIGGQLRGRVWLLGLVKAEPIQVRRPPKPIVIGHADVIVNGESAGACPVYGLPPDDPLEQPIAREQPGTSGALFDEMWPIWRFDEPIFLTEARGEVHAEVQQAQKHLYSWYAKRILGRVLKSGRPPGSGMFKDRQHFRLTMLGAAVGLRRLGQRVTQENIAQYFMNHSRPQRNVEVRHIRRLIKRYYGSDATWTDFRDDIASDLMSC